MANEGVGLALGLAITYRLSAHLFGHTPETMVPYQGLALDAREELKFDQEIVNEKRARAFSPAQLPVP